jgi:hypothetical protein
MATLSMDGAWWDGPRSMICFEIEEQGRQIPCCVDATCLFLAFGAKTLGEEDARACFAANGRRIRETASRVARKRRFEPDQLFLTARDL